MKERINGFKNGRLNDGMKGWMNESNEWFVETNIIVFWAVCNIVHIVENVCLLGLFLSLYYSRTLMRCGLKKLDSKNTVSW